MNEKEKLIHLEKRKQEVEEEILKEVERLARGKLTFPNLSLPC